MSISRYTTFIRKFAKSIEQGYFSKYLVNRFRTSIESENSFDPREINFNKYYLEDYWLKDSPNCKVDWLHSMNHVRLPAIYGNYFMPNVLYNESELCPREEFKKIKVLDIGCGGGILSEALAELNFDVTGIDPNPHYIVIAEEHARENKLLKGKKLQYFHTTIEDFYVHNPLKYDAIVISEVLDRIANHKKRKFLEKCISCLKYDGNVFITMRNRTIYSYLILFKFGMSYGLQFEHHDWLKGVKPQVLSEYLRSYGCAVRSVRGIDYDAFDRVFHLKENSSCWYFLNAVKNKLILNP